MGRAIALPKANLALPKRYFALPVYFYYYELEQDAKKVDNIPWKYVKSLIRLNVQIFNLNKIPFILGLKYYTVFYFIIIIFLDRNWISPLTRCVMRRCNKNKSLRFLHPPYSLAVASWCWFMRFFSRSKWWKIIITYDLIFNVSYKLNMIVLWLLKWCSDRVIKWLLSKKIVTKIEIYFKLMASICSKPYIILRWFLIHHFSIAFEQSAIAFDNIFKIPFIFVKVSLIRVKSNCRLFKSNRKMVDTMHCGIFFL